MYEMLQGNVSISRIKDNLRWIRNNYSFVFTVVSAIHAHINE